MKNFKKVFALLAIIISMAGIGGKALAASWDYGYSFGGAYSNYYHESKTHSATVVNRDTGNSASDTKRSGAWAKASIPLAIVGGKASFYYNAW